MLETVTILLFAGIVLAGAAMLYVSKTSPTDGQTFQAIAAVLHDFVGAFLMKVVPSAVAAFKGNGNGNSSPPMPEATISQPPPAAASVTRGATVTTSTTTPSAKP